MGGDGKKRGNDNDGVEKEEEGGAAPANGKDGHFPPLILTTQTASSHPFKPTSSLINRRGVPQPNCKCLLFLQKKKNPISFRRQKIKHIMEKIIRCD